MRKITAILIICLLFTSISYAGIVKYQGAATKGSAVAVYLYNTGTPATLFSDATGKTYQGNPVAANNSGTYSFYIEEGQYDLYVSLAGTTTATRNVSIVAPSLTVTNTWTGTNTFSGTTSGTVTGNVTGNLTGNIVSTGTNTLLITNMTGTTTMSGVISLPSLTTGKALCLTASNILGYCSTTPTNGACTCN